MADAPDYYQIPDGGQPHPRRRSEDYSGVDPATAATAAAAAATAVTKPPLDTAMIMHQLTYLTVIVQNGFSEFREGIDDLKGRVGKIEGWIGEYEAVSKAMLHRTNMTNSRTVPVVIALMSVTAMVVMGLVSAGVI